MVLMGAIVLFTTWISMNSATQQLPYIEDNDNLANLSSRYVSSTNYSAYFSKDSSASQWEKPSVLSTKPIVKKRQANLNKATTKNSTTAIKIRISKTDPFSKEVIVKRIDGKEINELKHLEIGTPTPPRQSSPMEHLSIPEEYYDANYRDTDGWYKKDFNVEEHFDAVDMELYQNDLLELQKLALPFMPRLPLLFTPPMPPPLPPPSVTEIPQCNPEQKISSTTFSHEYVWYGVAVSTIINLGMGGILVFFFWRRRRELQRRRRILGNCKEDKVD